MHEVGVAAALLAAPMLALAAGDARPLPTLRVPEGFEITLWADGIADARALARAPDGTVFVGSRRLGEVRALRDRDGDGRPDQVLTVDRGLRMPTGVAFHDGALYVAEVERIWRYPGILDALERPVRELVADGLPDEDHHGWREIAFGPDGWLYVSVGAPCNVCLPLRFGPGKAFETASILRMRPDGSGWETVARGVRNSVGLAFDPQDGRLWFTDNGRDWLGDDLPPCELNVLVDGPAPHYGFPYCHGGSVADPEYGAPGCDRFVPPAMPLDAHVAPLGLLIHSGRNWPEDYRRDVLIAEHGSWNRSERIGYRITRVRRDAQGRVTGREVMVSGWLAGDQVHGRPVDLLELPDGSVLVSDDTGGRIWRLHHAGAAADRGRQ